MVESNALNQRSLTEGKSKRAKASIPSSQYDYGTKQNSVRPHVSQQDISGVQKPGQAAFGPSVVYQQVKEHTRLHLHRGKASRGTRVINVCFL